MQPDGYIIRTYPNGSKEVFRKPKVQQDPGFGPPPKDEPAKQPSPLDAIRRGLPVANDPIASDIQPVNHEVIED